MTEQSLDVVLSTPTVEVTPATPQTVEIGATDSPVVVVEQGDATHVTGDATRIVDVYDPTQGLTYGSNPNNPFVTTDACNTTISGLYAVAGFAAVELRWTVNNDTPQYIEVWRAQFNSFASAECVGTAQGESYVDAVEPGETYFYWLVPVAYNGFSGTLSENTSVTTGNNQTGFVAALGELTAHNLSPELTALINKVIADSAEETEAINNDAIAEQVLYINSQFGELLSIITLLKADTESDHSYALAQLESQSQFFTSQFEAVASTMEALETKFNNDLATTNAAISTERTSRSTQYEAFAQEVNTVVAEYKGLTEDVDARITSEALTRSNETSGLATRMDTVESEFSTLETNTSALIDQKTTALSTANSAIAEQVNNLSASLDTTNDAVSAEITNRESAVATLEGSTTSRMNTLEASYNTVNARVTSEAQAASDATGAVASRVDTLEADADTAGSVAYATSETLVSAKLYADGIGDDAALALSGEVETFGTQLTNLAVQARQGNNLLDMSVWKPQNIDGTLTGVNGGTWGPNGATSENSLVLHDAGPSGHSDVVWMASSLNGGGDGGWNSGTMPVDHTKTYRSVVWIKKHATADGTTYLGCQGGNTLNLTGTTNTNPYFWHGDLPTLDKWYVLVGIIHGSGYTGSYTGVAGVYDPATGEKVLNGTEFKMKVGATTQVHRTYLYYTSVDGVLQYFAYPRFEAVDGNEPSLGALMTNKDFINTVSVTKKSMDGVLGEYAVKIDSNNRVAGFGLINGTETSAFDIVADKFSIANPDTPTTKDLYYDSASGTLKLRGQLILSNGSGTYTVSDLSDIQAQDGDTIYTEFQYSANGTSWHDDIASTDTYIRSRTVTNGTAGAWSTGTNLKGETGSKGDKGNTGNDGYTPVKGTDYYDGTGRYISLIFKTGTSAPGTPTGGSFNGSSETVPTGWSDDPYTTTGQITYVSQRTYTQQLSGGSASTTWSGSSWSSPSVFFEKGDKGDTGSKGDKGDTGDNGTSGTSGAGFYRYGNSTGTFPATSTANSYLQSAAGRAVVTDDVLTIYKTTDVTVSETRRYNGSSWVAATLLLDGDMIAQGTIRANRISTDKLSSIKADLGDITAGSIASADGRVSMDITNGSFAVKSAGSGARMEMTGSVIKVYDASGTLRVQLGDLSA